MVQWDPSQIDLIDIEVDNPESIFGGIDPSSVVEEEPIQKPCPDCTELMWVMSTGDGNYMGECAACGRTNFVK